jgi:hypothetical protein
MSARTCPCCTTEIDDQLFAQVIVVRRPPALAEFLDQDIELPLERELRTIENPTGGWFLRAWAALPFQVEWAPLQYGLWVQISRDQYAQVAAVYASERAEASFMAPLAVEWPGFPRSLGARCAIRFRAGSELVIVGCADGQITNAGRRRDTRRRHDELAELYSRAIAAVV